MKKFLENEVTGKGLIISLVILFLLTMITKCSNNEVYMIQEQRKTSQKIDTLNALYESVDDKLGRIESDIDLIKSNSISDSKNIDRLVENLEDIKAIASKKSNTTIILENKKDKDETTNIQK